jgi:hypothetical protein
MRLTDQERRCIELACDHLGRTRGGSWAIPRDETLQAAHPGPTPELVVRSERESAAVEVKRLVGDAEFLAFMEAVLSLERGLLPPGGGSFSLVPGLGQHLPLPDPLRRAVKKEIARVGPTLGPGQSGVLCVPRNARIQRLGGDGPGFIYCDHPDTDGLWRDLGVRFRGSFRLLDGWLGRHSFASAEGRERFLAAIGRGCAASLAEPLGFVPVTFEEEWKLTRLEDGPQGIFVAASTRARAPRAILAECARAMLAAARAKFRGLRWADLHVVVLDEQVLGPDFPLDIPGVVREVLGGLDPDGVEDIDLVVLVHGGAAQEVWARRRAGSPRHTTLRTPQRVG